jgi:hypothetical protein
MASHDDLVIIQVQKYHETEAAILVGPRESSPGRVQDRLKVWLPLGLITHADEFAGQVYELEIPRWLMEKKELQDYECE